MKKLQDGSHAAFCSVLWAGAIAVVIGLWVYIMCRPPESTEPVKAEVIQALDLSRQDVTWQSGIDLDMTQVGSLTFAVYKSHNIVLRCQHGSITLDGKTGSVTLSEGLELDEAARGFWEAVERAYPGFVQSKQDGK